MTDRQQIIEILIATRGMSEGQKADAILSALTALRPPEGLEDYDAGLLNDYGGGYVRVPLRPEPERIDAGAQRLVSWSAGCTWPDSWDPMYAAAARQDAERVYLEMVNYKETSHD